jgi:hypothetical protein
VSPKGTKQTIATHRVTSDHVSPADVRARIIEAQQRARADTRSDVQRWLGDPPVGRSALAQRSVAPPQQPLLLPALRAAPAEIIGRNGKPRIVTRFG